MHLKRVVAVLGLALAASWGVALAAEKGSAKGQELAGAWSGSWTGGSAGRFELTLVKESSGAYSGSISVTREDGQGYLANLDEVQVEGTSFSTSFKAPDASAAVTLKGGLEGGALKGTYSIHETQNGTEVESGTFTAERKP